MNRSRPSVGAGYYPGNQVAERYVQSILGYLLFGDSKASVEVLQDSNSPEIRSTIKISLTLETRSINHPTRGTAGCQRRIVEEAYSVFLGTCKFPRQGNLLRTHLEIHVIDEVSKESLAIATIALDGTLRLVTDLNGRATFSSFSPRKYRLVVRADG